jgi:hypothetical protein
MINSVRNINRFGLRKRNAVSWIRGSLSGGYEEYHPLGYNAV